MIKKFVVLIAIAIGIGSLGKAAGLNTHQVLSVSIFSASILGTLFFWDFRLSFAFIGSSLLLATKTIDLEHFVRYASLEVIMFLVGMMILIGLLKENGFFEVVSRLLLGVKRLTGRKFVFIMCVFSALMAATVDEVTSIIFMVTAILEICDHIGVNPTPFVITSVLATNIGSAATVLGNPIGILIATKSGLTFEDFILKAFPLAVVCLIATILICLFWYRKEISEMDEKMKMLKTGEFITKHKNVQFGRELKISLAIFTITLIIISLHRRLELLWGLAPNTILLTTPLFSSGLVMIWKWK